MVLKYKTDPNGKKIPLTPAELAKREKAAASKPAPAKKAVAEKAPRTPKPKLKATIMALNDENVYAKASQDVMEDDKQLIQVFTRWVNSGKPGEFFAIRRK